MCCIDVVEEEKEKSPPKQIQTTDKQYRDENLMRIEELRVKIGLTWTKATKKRLVQSETGSKLSLEKKVLEMTLQINIWETLHHWQEIRTWVFFFSLLTYLLAYLLLVWGWAGKLTPFIWRLFHFCWLLEFVRMTLLQSHMCLSR